MATAAVVALLLFGISANGFGSETVEDETDVVDEDDDDDEDALDNEDDDDDIDENVKVTVRVDHADRF